MTADSILVTVKKALGVLEEDSSFDPEIIVHINAALATLVQVGAGKPLQVASKGETWDDFKLHAYTQKNDETFEAVKLFVLLRTKLLFDPPPPSNVAYLKEIMDETLWRIREGFAEEVIYVE